MSVSPPAISLSQVTKTFHTRHESITAVNGIDLDVPAGEILAFLGPNGAGKTVTLDMILGLSSPTTGTIEVLGTTPRDAVHSGKISAVLQSGGLLRDLTVAETVRLIASTFPQHIPEGEAMERAGILSIAKRRVSKCSGGEQQRLRFALALLPNPDLLVLDEPTAGMDVTARFEFWDAMQTEAAHGRTIVFATHYLQEADTFAERIVMIAGGRIVADGTKEEIRSRVSGRTVSAHIAPHRLEDVRSRMSGRPDVQAVNLDHGRLVVHTSDSDAVARSLLTELGGYGLEVAPTSLDLAFTTLTSHLATQTSGAAQGVER